MDLNVLITLVALFAKFNKELIHMALYICLFGIVLPLRMSDGTSSMIRIPRAYIYHSQISSWIRFSPVRCPDKHLLENTFYWF